MEMIRYLQNEHKDNYFAELSYDSYINLEANIIYKLLIDSEK